MGLLIIIGLICASVLFIPAHDSQIEIQKYFDDERDLR